MAKRNRPRSDDTFAFQFFPFFKSVGFLSSADTTRKYYTPRWPCTQKIEGIYIYTRQKKSFKKLRRNAISVHEEVSHLNRKGYCRFAYAQIIKKNNNIFNLRIQSLTLVPTDPETLKLSKVGHITRTLHETLNTTAYKSNSFLCYTYKKMRYN